MAGQWSWTVRFFFRRCEHAQPVQTPVQGKLHCGKNKNEETYELQSDNDDKEVEPLPAPGADCGLGRPVRIAQDPASHLYTGEAPLLLSISTTASQPLIMSYIYAVFSPRLPSWCHG